MTDAGQRFRSRLYVLLLGAVIAALAWTWRFDTVPPDLMESLSVAAGLRPPASPLGLLWQVIAAPLCRLFGLPAAESILRALGHASLGALAVLVAFLLEAMLPASLRRGEHVAKWWRATVRFVLFQGVVLFCCADPVWNAFRWFSPASLQILFAAGSIALFTVYFKTDRRAMLFLSFVVLGVLAADTPVGTLLLDAFIIALYIRRRLRKAGILAAPLENPFAVALMAWRSTLAFLAGLFAGACLEICAFGAADGLAAFDWTWADYALDVPIEYIKAMLSLCSPMGALLILVMAASPVVLEAFLIRRATDDEKHLSYVYGLTFTALGLIALSQLSGAKPLWFWLWGDGCVEDCVLKSIAMYLFALSAVWALGVFMFEFYLRNFRRIETLRFQDAAEAGGVAALATTQRMQRIVRTFFLLEPALAFVCVVPFRAQNLERAMLGVVAEVAKETADECSDVEWLFTDGGLDAAVELAAAEGGRVSRPLRALSMMGSAEDPRDIYLRTRGVDDAADRALLEIGAADALRTWVRTRPDKATAYAVQIGFELWRRDVLPMPECSGLVARPAGLSPEDAAAGAAAGRAMAKRLLSLYENANPDGIADRALRDAFLFVQWRLAVIARHRANAYDERGKSELAMEETKIADKLDKKNGAIARIRDLMAWASRRKLERMTPQEGLKLGLARADFARARVFALRVLDVEPDDPAANFALGMDFFVQKQYARAQTHLERCLVRRPKDPAVLNNLAQCHLRRGDPEGALPFAKRALEILPDSPEVKRTVERVETALRKLPQAKGTEKR